MNSILRAAAAVFLAAALICSLTSLALTESEYEKADAIYEKSRTESFYIPESVPETAPPDAPEEYFPDAEVDLASLRALNPEVVGWLWIPGTDISFPLLRAEDNLKYLSRSYDLQWTGSGGIFMDYRNSADFTDGNTVIYGHNMKNGGMFGTLKDYSDPSFLSEHADLYIFTETEVFKYRIFTAYKTAADSLSYTRSFTEGTGFGDLADFAKSLADGNFTAPPDESRTLVTLSTCTSVRRDERLVAHAYFVASKPAAQASGDNQ